MQFFCCFYLCIHVESPYITLALYRVAGAGFKVILTAVVGFNSHHNYQCWFIGFPCLFCGCNWHYCQCRAIKIQQVRHTVMYLIISSPQGRANYKYTSAVATGSIASAEPTHQRLQLAVLPVQSRRYSLGDLAQYILDIYNVKQPLNNC